MKRSRLLLLIVLFIFNFEITTEAQCPMVACGGGPGSALPSDTPVLGCISCDLAEMNGVMGSTSSNSGTTPVPTGFCGSVENNLWFAFAAPQETVTFTLTASNCAGTAMGSGIQAEVYQSASNSCTGADLTSVSNCWSSGAAGTGTVTATALTPGETYYLMLDGWAGDVCDFSIAVTDPTVFGPPPPLTPPTSITANGPLCVPLPAGANTNFSVGGIPGATSYNWTIQGGPAIITSNPTDDNVDVLLLGPGAVTVCVSGASLCTDSPDFCETFNIVEVEPAFEVVEYCLGQVAICGDHTVQLPSPGPFTTVMTSYLGCDSLVNCIFIPVVPVIFELPPVTLCGPDSYSTCGGTHDESGVYFDVCEGANYQGCDSTVIVNLAILEPIPDVAPPLELGCDIDDQTVELDGSGSNFNLAPDGNTIFSWSGPSFCGPTDEITACVDMPGFYCLTLTHERDGIECSDVFCVDVTENVDTPFPPIINGPTDPCEGDLSFYTVSSGGGPIPLDYTWTTPNNEPITIIDMTTIQVDWSNSTGGQLCVTANNNCGPSLPTCIDVFVAAGTEDPQIDGPIMVCPNDNPVFSILNSDATATYLWTAPAGAFINGSGDVVTIDFSNSVSGDVCVTATNDCGSSNEICQAVTLLTTPAMPILNSGSMVVCSGSTEMYCVNDIGDATDWSWTTPLGNLPNLGACVDLEWVNTNGGEICVTANNDCGSSEPFCFNVTVDQAPTASLSGSGAICQGSAETVDLNINLTGTGPWDLVYNDGNMNINQMINASPFTLTVSNPGNYSLVSLSDQTNCSGTVDGQAIIDDNPQPTVALSGSGSICQGSGIGVDLTINLTGTPNWTVQWTVDGNVQGELNIMSSPFTLTINETQAGNIELTGVTDGNGCTNTGDGNIINIAINDAPIVSNIVTTCNVTSTGYVLTFNVAGGDSNSYSVIPNNGILDNGVFTSTEILSGTGYSFTVNDVNNCNPVLVEDASVLCDCTTAVGTMEQTTINECGDGPIAPVYDTTGEVLDGDDASVYILHTGSGISIVNPLITNNVGTSFTFDDGLMTYGTTYYISAVVGNDDGNGGVDLTDDCLAVAQGTPVIFYELPTATISGDSEICAGNQGSVQIAFTGSGPWNIEYDDGDAATPTEVVNGINSNPFMLNVNPTVTTTYTLVGVSSVNVALICAGSVDGSATVTVNTEVQVANQDATCNLTATGFVVTFEISGGDANSYNVMGTAAGTVTIGNPSTFVSDEIPTGGGYSFTVEDMNTCNQVLVEQATVICDCTTEVGLMDSASIELCGDGVIAGIYDNTDEVLDGDDVLLYVLHTGASTSLGTIIQSSDVTPTFSFDAGSMTYGTTYYISTVVGDPDGAGGVDDMDPCLAIAAGTPVVWYEIPTATLSGDGAICNGDNTDISVELSGGAPWSVTMTNDVGLVDMVTGINNNPFVYNVDPTQNAIYAVQSVQDANGCNGTVGGSATIMVNEAPTTTAPIITFNVTNTGYTLSFEIIGGDPASYEVIPVLGTISANAPYIFTSNEFPCGNGFNFQVDDVNGCGPVVVSQAMVICNCDTEAGVMTEANLEVCGTGPVVATYGNGEILDGNDVVSFILRDGNDMTIASNTEPSFSFNPTTMTYGASYNLCAVAGDDSGNGVASANDPCYSIGTVCTEVIFHEIPVATLAGEGSICNGSGFALQVDFTGQGPWSFDYVNNSTMETVTETNISDNPYMFTVSPTNSAVFTLANVFDANDCEGSGNGLSNITVTNSPVPGFVEATCNLTNTEFVVSFQITLGNPTSYVVTPAGSGSIDIDGIFTSNPIPTGSNYQFFVDDANGCGPLEVAGDHTCDCQTEIGIFIETEIEICGSFDAAIVTHTGFILDPDDVLVYVLHDGAAAPVGNIIATNSTPNFTFQAGMDLNTTYLITAMIGTDDGAGNVDVTDPCFASIDVPVTFLELPTITLGADETLCDDGGATPVTINFSFTGTGPFNVVLDNGQGSVNGSNLDANDSILIPIFGSTTFTVTSVTDGNGCVIMDSSEEIVFTINLEVDAGFSVDTPEFCFGTDATVMLDNLLAGADAGGQWLDSNGDAVNPMIGTVGLGIGTHLYTYLVDGADPCPDDMAEVSIVINDGPVADAGADGVLTCTQEIVDIEGNPSPGNVTYEWIGENVLSPNSLSTGVTQPGVYTLIVTNTDTGCTNSDEVEVIQEFAVPELDIEVSGISCFGDNDGTIIINSVSNGLAPYMYSFNGSDLSDNTVYPNLSPGDYTILVVDANGCQQELLLGMVEPAELEVNLEGNFEGDETIIDLGDSILLTVVPSIPFFDIDGVQWESSDSLNCDTCEINWVMPDLENTYSITVNHDGCTASDDMTIFVKKDLVIHVPNIFSPNEDGVNDFLTIFGNPNVVANVKSFNIFNRWGEAVYTLFNHPINDVTTGWNGLHRDEKVDLGIYVWFAEVEFVDGTTEIFKGDLMVIR